MNDINTVTLVGRLVADPELRHTQSGTQVLKFAIANNQSRKTNGSWEDEAHFFDVTMFGNLAESLSRYLAKGKQVCVHGTLKQERWEKDGQKRSKVAITASTVQLLGSRNDDQGGSSYAQPSRTSEPQQYETFNDDIPF